MVLLFIFFLITYITYLCSFEETPSGKAYLTNDGVTLLFSIFCGFTIAVFVMLVYSIIKNIGLYNELAALYEDYSNGIKTASSAITNYNNNIEKHIYWRQNFILKDFFSPLVATLPTIH